MKLFCFAFLIIFNSLVAMVAVAQPTNAFPLWPDGAPGAKGTDPKDIPTLTPYLAKEPNGAAMVICPGGGYGGLADHEGKDYALLLADHGITSFVLKYRLGSAGYRHPIMLQDVSRAVRLVRAKAAEWKLDGLRVGLMGSSAGGHLASTLLTHFDAGKPDSADPIEQQSSRPTLGILCYPVITMGEKTHAGSKKNLLGENPSADLVKELSNELHVTKDTPPCFLFHTVADPHVPVENSLMFADALRKAQVPFSLQVYENGGHGIGLGFRPYAKYERGEGKLHPWTDNCIFWLKEHGFATK